MSRLRPAYKYNQPIGYDVFSQRVRRHRRSDLLDAIAQLTAYQAEHKIAPPKELLLMPWALACAAKEALRAGNDFRAPGVSERDLQENCGAFNAVIEPFSTVERLMVQVAHEQFPYQVSDYEEMARPQAMYWNVAEECDTEILSRDFWRRLLGCDMAQASGVALLLSVSAQKNKGRFNLEWLGQPNFAQVIAQVPADVIARCVDWFSGDVDWFRDEANRFRSDEEQLRRYDYNPLIGRPLVSMGAGRFLAPSHPLILRRVSPSSLYFMALPTLVPDERETFTNDIGSVFERYVGRQLAQIPGTDLIPQISYDKGTKLSVDWFVIWHDLVLLVEAKSTPLTQASRAGLPRLEKDVKRTLGKGFSQLAASTEEIRIGNSAFAHIPTDRPHLGMVVTLEPYWMTNSPPIRALLPDSLIPSMAVSTRELEHFVACAIEGGGSQLLREVLEDPSGVLGTSVPPSPGHQACGTRSSMRPGDRSRGSKCVRSRAPRTSGASRAACRSGPTSLCSRRAAARPARPTSQPASGHSSSIFESIATVAA